MKFLIVAFASAFANTEAEMALQESKVKDLIMQAIEEPQVIDIEDIENPLILGEGKNAFDFHVKDIRGNDVYL
jgi:hypothetical protein